MIRIFLHKLGFCFYKEDTPKCLDNMSIIAWVLRDIIFLKCELCEKRTARIR